MTERSERGRTPTSLANLLTAIGQDGEYGRAWQAFVDDHSRILMAVASGFGRSYDERMEYYAHLLAHLQEDECRKLRAYTETVDAKFTTWLVVVARRSCLDHQRQRYGRSNDEGGVRRTLADFVCDELDTERLADGTREDADRSVLQNELRRILAETVTELPPTDQLLLTLRFRDGYSAREIARSLRLGSQWTVYRRVTEILKILRRELEQRGVDGPDG